jgi:hypothetical protein
MVRPAKGLEALMGAMAAQLQDSWSAFEGLGLARRLLPRGKGRGRRVGMAVGRPPMSEFPTDIYTEPDADADTLKNLGPLTGMAGIWTGTGEDVHPAADGPESQSFIERYELQPIDPQTNGPQLFYGLRYHTRIVKPDSVAMFHEQVGFWLWEPATGTVIQTLAIPRAQVAMAIGRAAANAKTFRLEAIRGSATNGIVSNPFLEHAFKTVRFSISVAVLPDGAWSYQQETVMIVPGVERPFSHTDRNRLTKIGEPTPNPLATAPVGRG